jgi:N-acetylmuramoyl-L-alanine amidase
MKYLQFFFISFLFSVLFILLTSFSPKINPFGIRKVVIDAGHGGKDPGCLGAGSKEKEVALNIALSLGKFIEENFKDVEVIYTRKEDVFVELRERAQIANSNKADLFICIHCNSGQKNAFGAETYVMGLHKTKDNLDVAKRENSAILMEENYEKNYEGFDPNSDEAHIIFTMFQSSFLDQSVTIASKIQHQFAQIGRKDRGVKQAGFLVLYKTSMPSVLIETGFLTHKEEEEFLRNKENQKKMGGALFEAFKEYKLEMDAKALPLKNKEIKSKPIETEVKKEEVLHQEKVENPVIEAVAEIISPITFKIQLTTSVKKLDIKSEQFAGLGEIFENEVNGMFRYTCGNETSLTEASNLQNMAREKGFKDAFITAYKNGNRIPVKDALKEINK